MNEEEEENKAKEGEIIAHEPEYNRHEELHDDKKASRENARRGGLAFTVCVNQVIHMVYHSDKKIKEHLSATFHFGLHGSTTLEGRTTSYNKCQVMSSEFAVCVWGLLIGISST